MKEGSLVYVIALVLMVCLLLGGECKHIITTIHYLLENRRIHVYEVYTLA
jgi:hypothetical protein